MANRINSTSIDEAHRRIAGLIPETPCIFEPVLSEKLGAKIYLKLENFQRTGSFKERGALNRLLLMTDLERRSGVLTASAGNHAQAVAYHAARLGIATTIFMPVSAPEIKISETRKYGANVCLVGESYDDAYEAASKFSQQSGAFYLHAYDDPWVIAGQGTVGLAILEQIPGLDQVIVPVGGGGLVAGVTLALEKHPIEVLGVRPLHPEHTLADGIRVKHVGALPSQICRKSLPKWPIVEDSSIVRAMHYLLGHSKIVAEGAGAAALAAVLEGRVPNLFGKTICVIISGGNIDVDLQSTETGHKARLVLASSELHG